MHPSAVHWTKEVVIMLVMLLIVVVITMVWCTRIRWVIHVLNNDKSKFVMKISGIKKMAAMYRFVVPLDYMLYVNKTYSVRVFPLFRYGSGNRIWPKWQSTNNSKHFKSKGRIFSVKSLLLWWWNSLKFWKFSVSVNLMTCTLMNFKYNRQHTFAASWCICRIVRGPCSDLKRSLGCHCKHKNKFVSQHCHEKPCNVHFII